jgi:hypothetical protein
MQCVNRARPSRICVTFQAFAIAHQHTVVIKFHAIKHQFTMAAMFFWPHDADPSFDAPARIITVKQKGRLTRHARHLLFWPSK